jgi:hypothetical protein
MTNTATVTKSTKSTKSASKPAAAKATKAPKAKTHNLSPNAKAALVKATKVELPKAAAPVEESKGTVNGKPATASSFLLPSERHGKANAKAVKVEPTVAAAAEKETAKVISVHPFGPDVAPAEALNLPLERTAETEGDAPQKLDLPLKVVTEEEANAEVKPEAAPIEVPVLASALDIMRGETKHQAFKRLAKARVAMVGEALRKIANLANKYNYTWTNDDVDAIFIKIDAMVKEANKKF